MELSLVVSEVSLVVVWPPLIEDSSIYRLNSLPHNIRSCLAPHSIVFVFTAIPPWDELEYDLPEIAPCNRVKSYRNEDIYCNNFVITVYWLPL